MRGIKHQACASIAESHPELQGLARACSKVGFGTADAPPASCRASSPALTTESGHRLDPRSSLPLPLHKDPLEEHRRVQSPSNESKDRRTELDGQKAKKTRALGGQNTRTENREAANGQH